MSETGPVRNTVDSQQTRRKLHRSRELQRHPEMSSQDEPSCKNGNQQTSVIHDPPHLCTNVSSPPHWQFRRPLAKHHLPVVSTHCWPTGVKQGPTQETSDSETVRSLDAAGLGPKPRCPVRREFFGSNDEQLQPATDTRSDRSENRTQTSEPKLLGP